MANPGGSMNTKLLAIPVVLGLLVMLLLSGDSDEPVVEVDDPSAEAIKDENESWGTVVVVAILMVAFLEYNTAQKEGGLPWWFVWALYDLIWVATALTYAQLVMAGDEVRTQVVGVFCCIAIIFDGIAWHFNHTKSKGAGMFSFCIVSGGVDLLLYSHDISDEMRGMKVAAALLVVFTCSIGLTSKLISVMPDDEEADGGAGDQGIPGMNQEQVQQMAKQMKLKLLEYEKNCKEQLQEFHKTDPAKYQELFPNLSPDSPEAIQKLKELNKKLKTAQEEQKPTTPLPTSQSAVTAPAS